MIEAEPGGLLGEGKEAEVFAFGPDVLKLYKGHAPKSSAFREAAHLAVVERLALPAPRVLAVKQFAERWGVVMTRATGTSFGAAMNGWPDRIGDYMRAMAQLHLRLHDHPAPSLASIKARLAANIARVALLDPSRRRSLLDRLASLPDGDRLCHGDFHPYNILGEASDAMIVDWLDAAQGPAAADVCRSYVLMHGFDPALAALYLDLYVEIGGIARDTVLAWLPVTAAARLAEGVPAEVDGLMAMVG